MNFPPTAIVTLARILRRDGIRFPAKCARYAFSRDAWLWLLRGGKGPQPAQAAPLAARQNLDTVRRSDWFDAEWYLRNYDDVRLSGADPAFHYASYGNRGHHDPGPDFIAQEYFELNPDIRYAGVNPLVHFEKYGKNENRLISFLQISETSFPPGAVEAEFEFAESVSDSHYRRTAIFAAFFPQGRIPAAALCYLRGLKSVADNIILVANCPVFPGEEKKLEGLVRSAAFRLHGGYDFYSYKLGWEKARALGLLDSSVSKEVIFANDSCYAPVFPFADIFGTMADRSCDFWGMTANVGFGVEHVQSFFYVFRSPVLAGGALDRFMDGIVVVNGRWNIVRQYELGLTQALEKAGHTWDTLVPRDFRARRGATPTKCVLETMREYHMPLVKVKAMDGEMLDDRNAVYDFIRINNPELADTMPQAARRPDYGIIKRLRAAHSDSFEGKIKCIRKTRIDKNLPVRSIFLVFSTSMFPARPLFDAMARDSRFLPKIVVVPDLRWPDRDPLSDMEACRRELLQYYPSEYVETAAKDESGVWADVAKNADIVCYPSPYDLSAFRYNPHWAVGRNFLPIYISYSFSTSIHGYSVLARQNYAYFWKVFAECEATAKEYAEHSVLKGANAEAIGYFKMDALATAKPWPRNGSRRRVLIAPHHSVEGGANDSLAFSNFQRYADYFLALPEKHPEIDFVFRPHPFLFTVLARPGKWGQAKVDDWIARMKAHPNVRWSDEGDYFPAFASCDAIVQDCGSYLAEWLYTGKPCCFMLKAPADIDAKFTPLGREILSHCYLAYDEAAIEAFLHDVVVGGSDPKAAARDEFRKSVMVNHPHAADAALASIRRALGMG